MKHATAFLIADALQLCLHSRGEQQAVGSGSGSAARRQAWTRAPSRSRGPRFHFLHSMRTREHFQTVLRTGAGSVRSRS